jgi:hypothetical protein
MNFVQPFWSYSVQLESQNSGLILKHPVLLHVCNYKFVRFFVPGYVTLYMNDLVSHLLPLNITSSVTDFVTYDSLSEAE